MHHAESCNLALQTLVEVCEEQLSLGLDLDSFLEQFIFVTNQEKCQEMVQLVFSIDKKG